MVYKPGTQTVEHQSTFSYRFKDFTDYCVTMIAKIAILAFVVAVVVADDYYKPSYGHQDYYDNIDYKFNYDIKDDYTYNYQSRDEYKDGKNIYGSYSLVEPDGKVRVVNYKADDYGFHADVDYKGGYDKPSYGGHDYYPKYKPSYQPSYQPSYKPAYKPSYSSYQPSYKPSYKPSYGYQPSYQTAYKPSYQPAYYKPSYGHSYQSAYKPSYGYQSHY